MKTIAFAAAAFAAVASFAGAASAAGSVPGSEYFTDARESAEINSVVRGDLETDGAAFGDARSFGFQTETGNTPDAIVPGSDYFREAARDAEIDAVARGAYNDGTLTVTRERGSALVPGSGSF